MRKFRFQFSVKSWLKLLLLFIVIGFITRLDNNDDWGCVIFSRGIFEIDNILLSGISVFILYVALLTKNATIRLTFFVIELIFWLLKLLFYKGGYAIGFSAAPNGLVVLYDYVGLLIRLNLLIIILHKSFKIYVISIISLIVILFKILFPFSSDFLVLDKIDGHLEESTHTQMMGVWIGELSYRDSRICDTIFPEPILESDTTLLDLVKQRDTTYMLEYVNTSIQIRVIIDSVYILLDSEKTISNRLLLQLYSDTEGYLTFPKADSLAAYHIHNLKTFDDSLHFDLTMLHALLETYDKLETYKIRLGKTQANKM